MAKRRHIVCLFCAWSIFVRCFSNFFCRFSLLLCFHLCWGFLLSFSVHQSDTFRIFQNKTIKYSKNKYVFMNSIERVKILSASLYLFILFNSYVFLVFYTNKICRMCQNLWLRTIFSFRLCIFYSVLFPFWKFEISKLNQISM